ncbi:MAG: hypothetical protein ABIF82_10300 [Planctomycetota bacterium]
MKMGYKAQLALLIAGQALLLALIAFFEYWPALAAIEDVDNEISLMSAGQAELCRTLKQKPNPDADIARSQAEIRRLEQRIPPESHVSWLSARITDELRGHDLDLRSATCWTDGGRHPAVPELKRLKKAITVRCAAQKLQAFLEAANELPFAVVVDDLSVTRDKEWGAVSARIELTTFVLRGGTPAASAAPATLEGNAVD